MVKPPLTRDSALLIRDQHAIVRFEGHRGQTQVFCGRFHLSIHFGQFPRLFDDMTFECFIHRTQRLLGELVFDGDASQLSRVSMT